QGTATHLAAAAGTQVALGQTQTVPAVTASPAPSGTPQPSATSAPTEPPVQPTAVTGEVAQLYNGDSVLSALSDESRELIQVPADQTRFLAITYLRNQPTFPAVT